MAEAMFDLARSHFRAKRTAAAAGAFSSALAFSARSGGLDAAQREMAHSMRGDCHTILGRFQEAEGDFSSSIELAPGVAVYYYKRGSARRKLAQHEGAVADLRRSVEMGCGLGKAELRQLEALSAGRAEATAASQDRSARTDGKPTKLAGPVRTGTEPRTPLVDRSTKPRRRKLCGLSWRSCSENRRVWPALPHASSAQP